ncbi:transcriptional regulator [Pseudonocardia spinosispora]|uniref:transcriptional regulator n=1 Tax=Pseudonocardia spinosispora TaxID=103441 RepID=UPI000424C540|nr:transcriptional regulator [Pseudonocardia spinosispora]
MTAAGLALLDSVQAELAPRDEQNRLPPLVAAGTASRSVFTLLALEQLRIVPSDWRSLHHLAARSEHPSVRHYFADLATGEEHALAALRGLVDAVGLDTAAIRGHEPLPGCQAYPSYFAWLALNAEPTEVAVAMTANFAAWGRYCAAISGGMRRHYGFEPGAVAFFDFFATPLPPDAAAEAIGVGIESRTLDPARARQYARLFQSYELMFWNTLADHS